MDTQETLFAVAPLLAVSGLAFALNKKFRGADLALRREGIQANRQIKQVLADLQQHRGMVNAFLNGDASFKQRIEKKQGEITRDITALDTPRGQHLMTARRWESIKSDWHQLRGEALSLTQEASFRRHSALIRAVLYSMGDVAERSQFVGAHAAPPGLVNALWSDLPAVAEGLGQARGLGSGVAAKGYCSGVARIKLRFLEERIRETMEWVSRDLAGVGMAQALSASIAQSWEETHKIVREFLSLLEEKLLKTDRPAIDAEHYFSAATQALDVVFRVFDQASDALDGAPA